MEKSPGGARSEAGAVAVLDFAAGLPGVRIDRSAYLRSALKRYCADAQVERAVATSPAAAGVSLDVITKAANTSIAYETSKTAGLAAAAGIPGGFAMLGTLPADLAQYVGHMLRVSQKLAYIYGWPDLFAEDGDDLDEGTEGLLMLFVGTMFGVQAAQTGLQKVSEAIAKQVAHKLPQRALMKSVIYPVVKKIAPRLGVEMNKVIFGRAVAKIIPFISAAISGGLTVATFLPMSKKLQKHLASLELTKPGHRRETPPTGSDGTDGPRSGE